MKRRPPRSFDPAFGNFDRWRQKFPLQSGFNHYGATTCSRDVMFWRHLRHRQCFCPQHRPYGPRQETFDAAGSKQRRLPAARSCRGHGALVPTCKAQAPSSQSLCPTEFKDVARFEIDSIPKRTCCAIQVRVQSTLITFKGKQETGRSAWRHQRGQHQPCW